MAYKDTAEAQINRWPDDRTSGNLSVMVQKLRTLKYPLREEQIAEILKAIDETCHFCWDNSSQTVLVCETNRRL